MTARLLTGAGCVVLSLLSVWVVDPDSRDVGFLAKGALWGIAGLLVVGLVTFVLRRRSPTGDRDGAQ